MKARYFALGLSLLLLGLAGCGSRARVQPPSPEPMPAPAPAPVARCDAPDLLFACPVPPLGTVRESAQRLGPLSSFWRSDCGCSGGQPQGKGQAIWCQPGMTEPCTIGTHLGSAFGVVRGGRLQGHVELRTALGRYLGTLDAQGGYQSGVLRSPSGAQFIGRFHSDGRYQSGALHQDGTVFIANTWQNNRPVGTVLQGQANGSYKILLCQPSGACKPQKSGKSPGLAEVWRAAGDAALGTAGTALRERLAVRMTLLRSQPYALAFDTALVLAINALRGA